ncbi:MAG TPA: hypothetical protein VMY77_16670 [Chitinophagaceae bacterium]|nr:hypothetical protein [Chitinophagaceae bacterium]
MKNKILFLSILFLSALTVNAQYSTAKLKLFIDCGQADCDFNYIRENIPVTDFVRDRKESDIHILISAHSAANGGEKYDVLFFGQKAWINNNDSMYFFTLPNSSEDKVRKQLVKVIQAGIIPYLAKAGHIDKLNLSFEKEDTIALKGLAIDKWNNWVFSIGGRGRFRGDKNYKEKNLAANGSAARVTETSKLQFSFYKSTSRNSYIIDENGEKDILKTTNNFSEAELEYVKSITGKWSWAVEAAHRKSSYDNIKNATSAAGGIEYNIFPYKISGSKFFALRYMIEVKKRNYIEETIYDRSKETLYSGNFGAYLYFTQPWGSISSSATWYNYFHDLSKNNFSVDANLELKLFKGISINFYGNASLIKDQLSLAKQGASAQEILLRLKALATNFNYFTSVGFNYRFGSKFNNFVNPRFTNGRY